MPFASVNAQLLHTSTLTPLFPIASSQTNTLGCSNNVFPPLRIWYTGVGLDGLPTAFPDLLQVKPTAVKFTFVMFSTWNGLSLCEPVVVAEVMSEREA